VKGYFRKLHSEELHDLCCSSGIGWIKNIKEAEMGRACGMYGGVVRCIIQGFGQET
jgi:hypothetical protein